jgi:nucleotide-binding universal stress UspA family protein
MTAKKGLAMAKTLVDGYDGSDEAQRALNHAVKDVDGAGKLFVVSVVAQPPDFYGMPELQHFIDAAHARGRELLEEAVAQIPEGVDVETELLEGDPADALVRVADARSADEIVIGSRGLGRVRAVLGSVSHDVLHLARVPVVVVPPRSSA